MSSTTTESKADSKCLDAWVKIFLVIASFVAVSVMIITLVTFFTNQFVFTRNLSNALNEVSAETPIRASSELLSLRMQYLERLSEMHIQASNRDLFVFLYSFLSSVLIGVSAYLVRKGHENYEIIQTRHKKLDKKINDLDGKYMGIKRSHEELEGNLNTADTKIDSLSAQAADIDKKIEDKRNFMQFCFVSQVLSDALTSILCFSIDTNRNGDLARFRESLHQTAKWCKGVDFSEIDKMCVSKFRQRFGYVRTAYEAVIKELGEYAEFDAAYIREDFDEIRESLCAETISPSA